MSVQPDPWTWRNPVLLGGYQQVDGRDEPGGADPGDPDREPGTGRGTGDEGGPGTEIELTGYRVAAEDGEIGTVDEATAEDGAGVLVVDTGAWISGRRVRLPATTVHRIDHLDRTVYVDLDREQVRDLPG
ncbi:PRC-barrel domain containing protein [Plantactinospora sp. KBS50]|uniref:PRC-barrel domain containing protein n=1 Tax=Plantactinospora sp. KBS50 TaxID=2024580 RepID=UPI0012FDF5E1|nr:PRC-barrel domain containing protein [Plantactinospora sp. KBS50]